MGWHSVSSIGSAGAAQAAPLTWWSHWTVEDSKKAVLFEAKPPGATVDVTLYDKKNMWPVLRAAFTAITTSTRCGWISGCRLSMSAGAIKG